jgi:hypothetical protein
MTEQSANIWGFALSYQFLQTSPSNMSSETSLAPSQRLA